MVLKRNRSTDDLTDPAHSNDAQDIQFNTVAEEPEPVFSKQPASADPTWTLDAFAPYQPAADSDQTAPDHQTPPDTWEMPPNLTSFDNFDPPAVPLITEKPIELIEHDHSLFDADGAHEEKPPYIQALDIPATVTVRLGRLSASYNIDRPELIVGRPDPEIGYEPDIAIDWDDSISRRHARIIRHEGRDYVEDMGSTNGTSLNGVALVAHDPMLIQSGDLIQLGMQTEIVYNQ